MLVLAGCQEKCFKKYICTPRFWLKKTFIRQGGKKKALSLVFYVTHYKIRIIYGPLFENTYSLFPNILKVARN